MLINVQRKRTVYQQINITENKTFQYFFQATKRQISDNDG